MQNWSKTVTFNASSRFEPTTSSELAGIVGSSGEIKVLGSGHSFSKIADTYGVHLSLHSLGNHLEIDREANTVHVSGAVRYDELGKFLWGHGYALHNLASLPHISVAGACATATHGSGDTNGNLATAVKGMQILSADGSIHTVSRAESGEMFNGMVVHLGALGVVTRLSLAIVPAFEVSQRVYENMRFEVIERDLDAVTQTAYSISFFTKWQDRIIDQVWLKELAARNNCGWLATDFYGAKPAETKLHPIKQLSAEPCTEQLGVPGPWHERLVHFKPSHTPSSGNEIQTEYFFDRDKAVEAMRRLFTMGKEIEPVLQISEIRTVAADDLWLSPSYGSPKVGIHFTWKPDARAVGRLLPKIEAELADLSPIPHWAKVFTMDQSLVRSRYPRLKDFQELVRNFDPNGIMRNRFLDEYVF
jgi:xylitol oxidase